MAKTTYKISLLIIVGLIIIMLILYNQTFGQFWVSEGKTEMKLSNEPINQPFYIDQKAEFPYSIDLVYKGYIDGLAIIGYGFTESTFYSSDTVAGAFDVKYKNDFYADTAFIIYKPLMQNVGNLTFEYRIYSSKK
jgi:hypothetical protein